jgi:hypothetical protein
MEMQLCDMALDMQLGHEHVSIDMNMQHGQDIDIGYY